VEAHPDLGVRARHGGRRYGARPPPVRRPRQAGEWWTSCSTQMLPSGSAKSANDS
jgi:hypothetical protein